MTQERATKGRHAGARTATAAHVSHLRTHHTTASRSRGNDVMGPMGPRWRHPELARASMGALLV